MCRFIAIIVLIFCLNDVLCRPTTNEPTKFTLGSYNEVTEKSNVFLSMIQQGEELLGRIANTIRLGRGRLINSAILARNIIADKAQEVINESQNNVTSILATKNGNVKIRNVLPSYETAPFANILPPKTRETVRLESESGQAFFERQKTNPVALILANLLKPTPIVDSIQEHEKYGNSGDKFMYIGRTLVNGFEGLSNFLNNIIDLPVDVAKKTSRGITEALNQLGSRIIGLQ